MTRFFEHIGSIVIRWVRVFTDFSRLLMETIYWIIMGPFKKKPIHIQIVSDQMVFMGEKYIGLTSGDKGGVYLAPGSVRS